MPLLKCHGAAAPIRRCVALLSLVVVFVVDVACSSHLGWRGGNFCWVPPNRPETIHALHRCSRHGISSQCCLGYGLSKTVSSHFVSSCAMGAVVAFTLLKARRGLPSKKPSLSMMCRTSGQQESLQDPDNPSRRGAMALALVCSVGAVLAPITSLHANAEAPDAGGTRLASLGPDALARAKGKVCIITGATSGVGLEAARTLVRNGATVYVCGRTMLKADVAVQEILATPGMQEGGGKALPVDIDLASFSSIRDFARKWKAGSNPPVDVFALNAGLALKQGLTPEEAPLSQDGYELTVATNHLGHFLLFNLLQDSLAPDARVVVTASSVHNPATGDPGVQATLGDLSGFGKLAADGLMADGAAYDSGKAYKDSKLCNVLFTLELARRLKSNGSKVTANCLSPGLIPSKTFFRNQDSTFSEVFGFAAKNILRISESTEFGGDCLSYMALDPTLDGQSGLFYSATPPGQHVFVPNAPSTEAEDATKAAELWKKSAAIVGV